MFFGGVCRVERVEKRAGGDYKSGALFALQTHTCILKFTKRGNTKWRSDDVEWVTHLNGVIDDEIDGDVRVDLGRVGSETLSRISHGRQIDNGRHSSEVLKNDTSRLEGNLSISLGCVGWRGGEREIFREKRGHQQRECEPFGEKRDRTGEKLAPLFFPRSIGVISLTIGILAFYNEFEIPFVQKMDTV